MPVATKNRLFLIIIAALFLLLCACADDHSAWRLPDACNGDCQVARDAATFADAVANATDAWNECICVENATITAAVTIVKPLTLVGRGPASRIVAPAGQKGLILRADGITLRDIEISSDTVALDVSQAQRVTLERVTLRALSPAADHTAFALAMNDTDLTFVDSTLTGDPATATAVGDISGGKVFFTAVTATGFGAQGLIVTGGATLSWTGGGMSDIRTENAALFIDDATVELSDVAIEQITTPTSGNILYGGRGIIATEGTTLDITDSAVRDCSSIGLLIDGTARAIIAGSAIADNALTGIWVQNGTAGAGHLTISDSTITGNRAAGVALFRSCGIDISDTRIEKTTATLWHDDLIGDGLTAYGNELADKNCPLNLTRVTFADNVRAGFIVDGVEGTRPLAGISFSAVKVERSAADAPGKYGVIIQNGTAPADLMAGVTANPFSDADAALDTPLPLMTEEQIVNGTTYQR
ncbi:MAG TPA: right-handed parallel beta-helix repeat-containing protein [bacterium]|nr:right-handed parallel beta-helix repeat-containing protein [bacterium]